MVYWLRAHEGERNTCFSKIQLVGQKNIETKHFSLVKAITNSLLEAQPIRTQQTNSTHAHFNISAREIGAILDGLAPDRVYFDDVTVFR